MTGIICNLCKDRIANQRNSHILPGFLKKDYLKTTSRFFHSIIIGTRKLKIEQDLPKEDFIFCSHCENRFNTIETIISKHLSNSYQILQTKSYPKFRMLEYEYQLFKNCNPKVFTLFVYSLIWRMHISNHPVFEDFVLPENCAEDLRKTLHNFLTEKTSELNKSLETLKHQRWDFIFIKPEHHPRGFSNINFNENISKKKISFIIIWEYIIVFPLNNSSIPKFLENYLNRNFKETRIIIFKNKTWNETSTKLGQIVMSNYESEPIKL